MQSIRRQERSHQLFNKKLGIYLSLVKRYLNFSKLLSPEELAKGLEKATLHYIKIKKSLPIKGRRK